MNEAHELTSLFSSILSAGNSSIVSDFELWISDLFRISDFGFRISSPRKLRCLQQRWRDVVLLEQGRLSGGTTWHAAGMVGQLRASNSMTRINKYSAWLDPQLEAETGHDVGWVRNGGGLTLATSAERMTQLRRTAAMADVFGVEAHLVGPREALDLWPLMQVGDVLGAVHSPGDGRVIPGECTVALAKGALKHGSAALRPGARHRPQDDGSAARGARLPRASPASATRLRAVPRARSTPIGSSSRGECGRASWGSPSALICRSIRSNTTMC